MNSEHSIRLMVVDDHEIVRAGLMAVISQQPDMVVVAEAADGRQAVELFRQHRPDITLMDLSMPIMSGLEAITIIQQEFPESRIIALTLYDGEEDIHRALKAGACNYLLKRMYGQQFIKAIRDAADGRHRLPAVVEQRLAERLPGMSLTSRELEILALIVEGRNNREIAASLSIGEGTVKWFVNIILSKLGVRDRTQAVSTALRRGIVHL